MPCYTLRRVTVELNVSDPDILIAGLKAQGFTVQQSANRLIVRNKAGVTGAIQNGRITFDQGNESIVNEIKRAYSHQVVKVAAKRFSWQLTSSKSEPNTVVASRRF